MKKEKDPIKKEDEDKFHSLFSKIIKHNPNKKKLEDKTPKKDK